MAGGLTRAHRASLVSDAVPRRIARSSRASMQVQGIYRSVVNITTVDGLLTVASPEAGGLPNGIMVDLGQDWRTIGLRPGMAVCAGEAEVRVPDAGLEIRLDGSARWSPRFSRPDHVDGGRTARWRRRAVATRAIARDRASAGGLGALLRGDTARDDRAGTEEIARPIVAELIVALGAGDRPAATGFAGGLIGLGPGLTPSGDDLLVGIEAALHALDRPTAGFLTQALDGVEARTTALAATLLRHAAAGEFAERLHMLLGALLGSDEAIIVAAIDRATAWGATSGTDCLLGVLIGLDATAGVGGALA